MQLSRGFRESVVRHLERIELRALHRGTLKDDSVILSLHRSRVNPPSMDVAYKLPLVTFDLWICAGVLFAGGQFRVLPVLCAAASRECQQPIKPQGKSGAEPARRPAAH